MSLNGIKELADELDCLGGGGFNSDLASKIVGMCETASEPHFLQWICTIFS